MVEWFEQHNVILIWLGVGSVITMFGTAILVTWFLVRIPPDYFDKHNNVTLVTDQRHPLMRYAIVIAKNILGVVFIIAGLIMLFIPGQGLLTIIIGLFLLSIPGKQRLQMWLLRRKSILNSINAIRRKAKKPPLELSTL